MRDSASGQSTSVSAAGISDFEAGPTPNSNGTLFQSGERRQSMQTKNTLYTATSVINTPPGLSDHEVQNCLTLKSGCKRRMSQSVGEPDMLRPNSESYWEESQTSRQKTGRRGSARKAAKETRGRVRQSLLLLNLVDTSEISDADNEGEDEAPCLSVINPCTPVTILDDGLHPSDPRSSVWKGRAHAKFAVLVTSSGRASNRRSLSSIPPSQQNKIAGNSREDLRGKLRKRSLRDFALEDHRSKLNIYFVRIKPLPCS
ncbi:hypothetical protein BP6252_04671 [Coleophoma cylindrospora]|uniref:Uncharacterized protein n=1 Tax=Coleophoma cylindrospora TaxID=1849047 RepID=A0A3D8S143_9HELO|nr:hypothetical protein BP6252_04671 [Coleophoma cylindrospora]